MSKKTKRDRKLKKSNTELPTGHRSKRWLRNRIWAGLGMLIIAGALVLFFRGPEVESAAQDDLKPVSSIHYQSRNHIHGLGYDSQNKRLFVATHYGLFVWKDGQLFQLGDNRDDFMGFSLVPTDPKTIFTSGHPKTGGNMGVMKSQDGGMTFKNIFRGLSGETVDFHSMVVSSVDPKLLYGWFHGKLYRTKDGGKSWQFPAAQGLPSQGFCWGGPCFAPDSRDGGVVYSGTPNGLLVSRDYGESWTRVQNELGAVAAVGVHLNDPRKILAFADRLGFVLSQDTGKSWKSANDGLNLQSKEIVFAFSFDRDNINQVFAATGERIFRSTDGGKSWKQII
jgi:photosystem II stability/assembly factor-like uncharacterized protein